MATTTKTYSDTYTGTTTALWTEVIIAFKPNVTVTYSTSTAATSSPVMRYVLTDHFGSMNVVLDQTGNIIETADYYPYGAPRIDVKVGTTNEARKYIGEYYDNASTRLYIS